MNIHGYVRASTNRQKDSPEIQWDTITKYCEHNKLGPPLKYADPGVSGKKPLREREAGSRLCCNLKRGDHVVISKLDRAFRSLSDCVIMLDEFIRMDVHLHVCNIMGAPMDLSSSVGRLVVRILAVFAEFERELISERISEACAARKREGRAQAAIPPYGFTFEHRNVTMENGTTKLRKFNKPNPHERAIMAMLLNLCDGPENMSIDDIRQHVNYELKLPSRRGGQWSKWQVEKAISAERELQLREKLARDGLDLQEENT